MEKIDRRSLLAGLFGGTILGAIGAKLMLVQRVPYPQTVPDITTIVDGVWTWFSDPRAIYVGGDSLLATVTQAGRIGVYQTDGTFTDLRGSLFQVDDHANPSLLVRSSDSKILAFAAAHNGSALYSYLSTNANDPSAFGAETSLDAALGLSDYSYTNPVQLTDEADDPIYLFFRADDAGTRHYFYSKSTDQGATWAAATQLLANNGLSLHPPYVKLVQNGNDRIDFFCTDGHPQHLSSNSIYHFYYEGGNFKDTAGNNLVLPIEPASDLTPLYDGTTTKAWIWDCAIDGSGNPVCVYATFPSTTDHRYRYAKWGGSAWDDNEICTAGSHLYPQELYYSGGVTIDPLNVNKVIASRSNGGAHTLYRYVTTDGGATWSETQITEEPEVAIRPYFVRGQTAEPRLCYVTGTYTSYTNYDTSIVLTDSGKSPSVITGTLIPAGDMNAGSDSMIPSGDMDSGSDLLLHQEVSFG